MAKKAKKPPTPCDCVEQFNELLKEHNTQISQGIRLNFDDNTGGASQPYIVTEKIDKRKRGAAKTVLCSYCPFCGKEYPSETT
jgi:hypothetical protein